MKKTLLPALVALALILAPTTDAAAQAVVNDPLHMGVHIGEFAKHLKQWTETVKNYQVIKDAKQIAGVTKDITGQVKDITDETLQLQRQVQADLRKVQSIQDLRLSNPQELFARALAMSGRGQSNQYMPVFQKAERLRQALQLNNPQQDLNTVYDVFSRFGSGATAGNNRMSSQQYQQKREEAAVSTFAYEEMMQKKKIATAFGYYKIADEMTQQSIEMNATLKNPGRYAMTEGERMVALNTSNDNMIKAMQLRQEADRLLAEAAQPGPARQAAEMVYSDILVQNALIKADRARPRN
jgi:predicted transcriptional regulator